MEAGVVLSIYVLIVNKGAGDSGSVGFFVAFIPTLITGGGAWFGKKALFKRLAVSRMKKCLTNRMVEVEIHRMIAVELNYERVTCET